MCEKEIASETIHHRCPKVGHRALLVRDPLKIYKYALPAAALLAELTNSRTSEREGARSAKKVQYLLEPTHTHTYGARERGEAQQTQQS